MGNGPESLLSDAPVFAAGCGGSGTRVVAQILMEAGVYLGLDQNRDSDSLAFTYLFKHPQLFSRSEKRRREMAPLLFPLFERTLCGGRAQTVQERLLYLCCGALHMFGPYFYKYHFFWFLDRWRALGKNVHFPRGNWGWKEPHSVFFLDEIKSFYPSARYIHVVRHGLDMVYSKQQQQLRFWGDFFGLNKKDMSPINKFELWYRLNSYGVEKGREKFGDNMVVVRFEDLIFNAKKTIIDILNLFYLSGDIDIESLCKIPKRPSSLQRYKNKDLSWVDGEVERKLARFGYGVDSLYVSPHSC